LPKLARKTMPNETDNTNDQEKSQKIQSLREMISSAEKTIQGAKAMLLQLEGKKKAGRRRKLDDSEDGGEIVQGTFDGQLMIGSNGKQYPVPANYASKSKLVEGDLLKLTITEDGSFIYKQIGPAERRHALGIVTQDENGNYYIVANGKPYRVLLASVTYFKAEPGDEAAIVIPRDIDSQWAAIENIVQKAKEHPTLLSSDTVLQNDQPLSTNKTTDQDKSAEEIEATPTDSGKSALELLEEWRADIEEIEKEMAADNQQEKKQ